MFLSDRQETGLQLFELSQKRRAQRKASNSLLALSPRGQRCSGHSKDAFLSRFQVYFRDTLV